MNHNFYVVRLAGLLTLLTSLIASQSYSDPNYYYSDHLTKVARFTVPKHAIPWVMPFPRYQPPEFTSHYLPPQPYADPDIHDSSFTPAWNSVDGLVDRTTYQRPYTIFNGYPLNPWGRTGIRGRGVLPRWGPNHAANSIVTRWKRDGRGNRVLSTGSDAGKPVLQVAIIRPYYDSLEWALLGGLIEVNSDELITLQRQLLEEALNLELDVPPEMMVEYQAQIGKAFDNRTFVYRGHVHDRRNTDNAWIEAAIFLVHDEDSSSIARLPLPADNEADRPVWMDVDFNLHLFPGYYEWMKLVALNLDAHWQTDSKLYKSV